MSCRIGAAYAPLATSQGEEISPASKPRCLLEPSKGRWPCTPGGTLRTGNFCAAPHLLQRKKPFAKLAIVPNPNSTAADWQRNCGMTFHYDIRIDIRSDIVLLIANLTDQGESARRRFADRYSGGASALHKMPAVSGG
jgi:hypothetical protein